MNKRVIISLVLVALMGFGTAIGTYAWFTSNATSTENVFTAGTLNVAMSGKSTVTEPFAVTGDIQPGDVITNGTDGVSEIIIENTGNLDLATFFRFKITEDNGNGNYKLADKIIIDSMKMEFLKADNSTWETADQFITNGTGSGAYPEWYTTLAGADNKISLAEWTAAGNAAMGLPYGWQEGALKKDNKYKLSFRLKFDETADNNYQGLSLKGQFEAYATQVNTNAIQSLFDNLKMNRKGADQITWLKAQIDKQ